MIFIRYRVVERRYIHILSRRDVLPFKINFVMYFWSSSSRDFLSRWNILLDRRVTLSRKTFVPLQEWIIYLGRKRDRRRLAVLFYIGSHWDFDWFLLFYHLFLNLIFFFFVRLICYVLFFDLLDLTHLSCDENVTGLLMWFSSHVFHNFNCLIILFSFKII